MASSIDVYLTKSAKQLKPGETITFTLVKGPTVTSSDNLNKKELKFPRMAKFNESVMKPDFLGDLAGAKMFDEDIPKAKDESDSETEDNQPAKKRRRRILAPRRHFVIQPRDPKLTYNGVPESSGTTHYVMMKLDTSFQAQDQDADGDARAQPSLIVTPLHGFHTFSQPSRVSTLSMHEAEQAISDQRKHMTRYMMHSKMVSKGVSPSSNQKTTNHPGLGATKARLLGKLVRSKDDDNGDNDAGDDVMGDLAFRNRKGAGSRARKELLSDLGDGVTVDDDGVLGGANDAEFGGRRRFGRLAVSSSTTPSKDKQRKGSKTTKEESQMSASTLEGAALDDDFYQRDVAAEYEHMDYDANEQFDDDDVDLGQNEVEVDNTGFAVDNDDEDNDDEDYEDDASAGPSTGVGGGLATKAGLKVMLARAQGENVDQAAPNPNPNNPTDNHNAPSDINRQFKTSDDHTTSGSQPNNNNSSNDPTNPNLPNTINPSVLTPPDKPNSLKKPPSALRKPKLSKTPPEKTIGPDGLRLITLDAIRREIWLHHGQIRMKQLMKIFSISGKKTPKEKKNRFREFVKELCTMRQDSVEGNLLVLKQHYSNMG